MVNRQSAGVCAALILAMTAAGLWAMIRLPAGALVPIHFDASGRIDGWASAQVGLSAIPLVALATWILLAILPRIDPRGYNLQRSAKAYGTIWLGITLLLAVVQGMIVAGALGEELQTGKLMLVLTAALLIGIGNVMGKLRWNFTVGIRTPWTLMDERVWDKTHRFGGRALVLGGFVLIACVFLPVAPRLQAVFIPAITAGIALLTIVRSYFYWVAVRDSRAGQA
jgi:uncharacterized membrane protein